MGKSLSNRKMARGSLSENDRQRLDSVAKSQTDCLQENNEEKNSNEVKSNGLRVRFLDEEGKTERLVSADEVDHAVTRVKKIHILKNRSSSETSILLRNPSMVKRRLSYNDGYTDNLNNNCSNENLNGKITKDDKTEYKYNETKEELGGQNFKKNFNIYSVNQAKTITSERKKSTALSSIPKLIGHKTNEAGLKSILPAEGDFLTDAASGKDFTARAIGRLSRGLGKLLRRTNSVRISEPDPVFKVAYLGNVLTGWARGKHYFLIRSRN